METRVGSLLRAAVQLQALFSTKDVAWKSMARSAAGVLGITSLAQILSVILQVLFARLLGPVEFGVYSVVIAGLGLCLILSKLGLDTTLVRLVAEFNSRGDAGRLRGLVRFARITGPVLGIFVGVFIVLVITKMGEPESPSMYQALLVGAVILPIAVYSELTAATLRGLRRVVVALAGDGIARPCVAAAGIVIVAAYWPDALTGSSALLVYLAGSAASIALSTVILHSALPTAAAVAGAEDIKRYLRIALPLMLAGGFLVAMYSLDVVMLGLLADTTIAGFYSVASRIAIVVLFAMNAAQMVAAPMLAAASAARPSSALREVIRTVNIVSILVAVPAGLLLLVAAEPILGMFGAEFRQAAPALRVLVLSQLLNVFTGPTGMVLSMTGHERSLAFLLFAGISLNAVLNLVWIPDYGLMGAAASALVAHAAWNLAGVFLIKAKLAIDVTPLDLLRRIEVRTA